MVKVNLLRKEKTADAEPSGVVEDFVGTAAAPDEPEPPTKKEKAGKKGGRFKTVLLIFFAIAAAGSAYVLYTKGWEFTGTDTDPEKKIVIADETAMELPSAAKPDKPVGKVSPKKLSTPIQAKEKQTPRTTKVKSGQPAKRKSPIMAGGGLRQIIEGRIILDVFRGIVASIEKGSGNLKLSVSPSRVTLALGLNSRNDAALLLRSIRQRWPMSNLRAVRFQSPTVPSGYNYSTQFDGSVKFRGVTPSSGTSKRRVLALKQFRKTISDNLAKSGLSLKKFDAGKEAKRNGSSITPVEITVEGANESIVLFIDSLMKLDAAYEVSRAAILGKDESVSTLSLYLKLVNPGSRALS